MRKRFRFVVCAVPMACMAGPLPAASVVVEPSAGCAAVERIGPPTYHMPHLDRFSERPPGPYNYPIPRETVTRDTYMQWIEGSGHLNYADGDRPDNIYPYGPRHYMPVLARYVQTGERRWGEVCLRMLRAYGRWLQREVDAKGWHSNYMHEPTLIGMYARHLTQGGLLDMNEEWFREMILFMNRTIHVWGTQPSFWRGPMHRSQGEGIMKGLAALWYPDAPDAEVWRDYAGKVYQDFWEFRDNPANDTGYYYGTTFPLFLGAELRDDGEFFTDPGMQPVFDRLLHEITPDGAIAPYGAHGGWNSSAAQRIWMLELLAARTGDGRYRFGAHKLMNYMLYQQDLYMTQHILAGPQSTEQIALAYLLADDSIAPVQPDPASRILYRKETLRIRNKQVAERYLHDLDPAPDKANICCNLLVTDREMPAKLVLRSGWAPGDFFALIDLFPRHDPLNVPGILGLTRWGAPLTQTFSAKGSSDENRLTIEDRGGTAGLRRNSDPELADPHYQEVDVEEFADFRAATVARVAVSDYQGFPVTYTREFVFAKNRFLFCRDTAHFEEGFLARIGPVFNTQNIGPQLGTHWANTYFTWPRAQWINTRTPPQDLLVYFGPQPGFRMEVLDRTAIDPRAADVPVQLRYVWQGVTEPDQRLLATQVYYPHAPSLKMQISNAPGDRTSDLLGTAGADGIALLRDAPELTVARFAFEESREEWVVCNPAGAAVDEAGLQTDARYLYVDAQQGEVKSVSAVGATYLTLAGAEVFRHAERSNHEK